MVDPRRASRLVEGIEWDQRCRWDAQRSRSVGTTLAHAGAKLAMYPRYLAEGPEKLVNFASTGREAGSTDWRAASTGRNR